MRIFSFLIALFLLVLPGSSFGMLENGIVHPGQRGAHIFTYQMPALDSCSTVQKTPIRRITFLYESSDDSIAFTSLFLMRQGRRISTRKKVDPESKTVTFSLPRSRGVYPCNNDAIFVYANIAKTTIASSKHRLRVELTSDVNTDSESVGIPTQGPWIEIR